MKYDKIGTISFLVNPQILILFPTTSEKSENKTPLTETDGCQLQRQRRLLSPDYAFDTPAASPPLSTAVQSLPCSLGTLPAWPCG